MLVWLLLVPLSVSAQSVVSAAGGGVTGLSGTFDYTLGEMAVQTVAASDLSWGEGVQQPYGHPTADTVYAAVCQGQPFNQYGFELPASETATVGTVTRNRDNGDGTFTVLVLTVNPTSAATDNVTACDSLVWHGVVYRASCDDAVWTTANVYGCDSVVSLHLKIGHATGPTTVETQAEETYTWYGTTYTTSGIYTHTLVNAEGCDSIVRLRLSLISGKPMPHIYAYKDKAVMVDHFPNGADQPRVDYITYRWYQDGSRRDLIRGDVYSQLQDNHYEVLTGCFYVEVPTDASLGYWVRSNTVCIQSPAKVSDDPIISVYPNPAGAGTEVRFVLTDKCVGGDLRLYDALGRQLLTQTIAESDFSLPMPQVSGAYTVRILDTGGEVSVRKIIVR